MKATYIKPCFKPITLSANGGSDACSLKTAHNAFEQCTVDVQGLGSVFSEELECDYINDPTFGVCYFTSGPNTTVFGSN